MDVSQSERPATCFHLQKRLLLLDFFLAIFLGYGHKQKDSEIRYFKQFLNFETPNTFSKIKCLCKTLQYTLSYTSAFQLDGSATQGVLTVFKGVKT